jgi:hypothetical protein
MCNCGNNIYYSASVTPCGALGKAVDFEGVPTPVLAVLDCTGVYQLRRIGHGRRKNVADLEEPGKKLMETGGKR